MSEVPTEVATRLPDSEPGEGATSDPGLATTLGSTSGARARADREVLVRPGDELGGRYRIIERIGAGGMGTVYLAEHIAIGKRVAIKVLGVDFAYKERLVDRFLREARAASLIEHQHIVDITDFGHVTDGVPYFAMEFLEGRTLREVIEQEGPLPWPRARRIFEQICVALDAAHQKGVIHRDMKPDNVFLVKRGNEDEFVKVLDFGIAKLVTEEADQGLTQTGAVIGTAAYMSPEQAQSLEVDPRTDVYSAGIILYQMLTGRVPFTADGFMGVVAKHLTERPPPMRTIAPEVKISSGLERVVLKALRKQREDRYGSINELAAALEGLGEGIERRGGGLWIGVTAAAAAAALAWWMWPSEPPDSAPAVVASASDSSTGEPEGEPPSGSSTGAVVASSESGETGGTASSEAGGETTEAPASATDTGPSDEPSASPSTPSDSVPLRVSNRDIKRGLHKARKQLDACGAKHAGFGQVNVTVSFEIGPDGRVKRASVPKGLSLGGCVERVIGKLRFPTARKPTKVTRKLVLN